ncbi:MAG TPA: IS66 family insertion sequence element accessory protein TnpB, partial [Ottowia sp.]|nr:IS66 family insertion sequence element accessory protein TnpB [Ottowia sp.]
AAVALTHGINANIVHRWLREHPAKPAPKPINPFIPLPLPAPQVEDAEAVRSAPGGCADIRVEIRRGTGVVTVNWPVEAASSCADWLRDWLR